MTEKGNGMKEIFINRYAIKELVKELVNLKR